jgi:hypothetical protein
MTPKPNAQATDQRTHCNLDCRHKPQQARLCQELAQTQQMPNTVSATGHRQQCARSKDNRGQPPANGFWKLHKTKNGQAADDTECGNKSSPTPIGGKIGRALRDKRPLIETPSSRRYDDQPTDDVLGMSHGVQCRLTVILGQSGMPKDKTLDQLFSRK